VPFHLEQTPECILTEGPTAEGGPIATIALGVARPKAAHILISSSWVARKFDGRKVGEVILRFADGTQRKVALKAGRTIRETWLPTDRVTKLRERGHVRLHNVRKEPQMRGEDHAFGFLDLLTIDIDAKQQQSDLESIQFVDTSRETLQEIWPTIHVFAITIESVIAEPEGNPVD